MKISFLLSIFCLFVNQANAQLANGDVDITPIFTNCDKEVTYQGKVDCTEESFLNYMFEDINKEACPDSDSVIDYKFTFLIDEKGNIKEPAVFSPNQESACTKYFQMLAESLPTYYEMHPAMLNGEKVAFRKHYNFSYPLTDTDKKVEEDKDFPTADRMPRFEGCEEMKGTDKDKNRCAQSKMLTFIYKTLKYPAEARQKGIEGMAVVQFYIDTMGYINEPKVVKSIGGGTDEAVLDVIAAMNELNPPFVPGQQGSKKVNVKYTLPIKFKLEASAKNSKK